MKAEEIRTALPRWRREFHAHAEEGWTEFWTTARVAGILQSLRLAPRVGAEVLDRAARMGLPAPQRLAAAQRRARREGADESLLARMHGCTGVVADVGPATAPVALALRFDLDALPLVESHCPEHAPAAGGYASLHAGQCHACGHDAHTALGLGLAARLQSGPPLRRRIRLIFQPAEEGVRGAAALLAQVRDVPRFLALHVGLGLPSGELTTGAMSLMASTKFDAVFSGRAAHAAKAPHQGRDALKGAAAALLGLHALPRCGSGENRVHVGELRGGGARNVVADKAVLRGETRAANGEMAEDLYARARDVLEGAAAMYGLGCRINVVGSTPDADSDADFAAELAAIARELRTEQGKALFRQVRENAVMGASDDAAVFMRAVQASGGKAAYAILGCTLAAGHHAPRFDLDEDCLWPGLLWLEAVCRRLATARGQAAPAMPRPLSGIPHMA